MQEHNFVFDDIHSADYGMYVLDYSVNAGATREYEAISIPGRNGDLHIDGGRFENRELAYSCVAMQDADRIIDKLDAELSSKIGYYRLEDSFNPDVFYLAQYVGDMDTSMAVTRDAGSFVIRFSRKPQKFLRAGESKITFSEHGYIFNPTRYEAKPLLEITGAGQFFIGNQAVTVTQELPNLVIDCDIEDAYDKLTKQNYNQYIQTTLLNFPVIESGQVGILPATGMTITVTPRWWTI